MENVDHMRELEELLREVLAEMIKQEYENRPKHIKRHFFSLRFRRRMRRMAKEVRAKRQTEENASPITDLYRPIRSKRRWLILLALLMVLVGGTVTGAEPVICRLFEYCMEQHGNFVEMESREDNSKMATDAFAKYEFAEVPEGYELVEEEFKSEFGVYQISYANSKEEILMFRQSLQENGNHGNVTSEREGMEEVKINDFQGYFVEDFDTGSMVLSDGTYMIELSGKFSKEELLSLAESLRHTE